MLVFAWLVVPILVAYFLSRTGRYESAHVLSSLALTGLVTRSRPRPAASPHSPPSGSWSCRWRPRFRPRAAWSRSRRLFALGAAGLLVVLGERMSCRRRTRMRRPHSPRFGIVSAVLYATGLALGAEALARTSFLAALRRGRPLPASGAQHDRRHHAPWPRRRGVVRLAGRSGAVRRAGCRSARPRTVRPRPCRRSPGLSHGAG